MGVGEHGSVAVSVNPALIASPADGTALSVNRIRMVVANVANGLTIGSAMFDVDATESNWTLSFDVRLSAPAVDATLTVSLIHVAPDGTESVQFSGVVTPLKLVAGGPAVAPEVPILRAPPENALVTGIAISSVPDTLLEGRNGTLAATVTTSSPVSPLVYWTVLDTAVLSVSRRDDLRRGDVAAGCGDGDSGWPARAHRKPRSSCRAPTTPRARSPPAASNRTRSRPDRRA